MLVPCGDTIEFFRMITNPHITKAGELPLGPGVRLLSANSHGLVALDKPAGILSHPNQSQASKRALLNAEYNYDAELYTWQQGAVEHCAWLVNRLDSPTSGVILLALNESINRTIKQLFSRHKVHKVYYALVKRVPSELVGSWNDHLIKRTYGSHKRILSEQMVSAKTRYEVQKVPIGGLPVTLLKLMPLTGRTHQLRIQCQKHRHPIIGDRTYGSFSFNKEMVIKTGEKRMMLHAGKISIRYLWDGRMHTFHAESTLPEAFNTVMRVRNKLA